MSALVAAVAIPGSGKTTWLSKRFQPTQIVCLDQIRGWLSDDTSYQGVTPEAVQVQDLILEVRCRRRLVTAVDATNLRGDVRDKLVHLAVDNLMTPVAVVFDIPFDVCLDRNAAREQPVPVAVMERMRDQFTAAVPPTGSLPGFTQTVRVQLDGTRQVFGVTSTMAAGPKPWLV